MTDLRDLKQDIDHMHLPTPPMHDIVELAERGQRRRRRVKRQLSAATMLVALVALVSILVVSRPAEGPKRPTSGPERYLGTASVAFVSRTGFVYVADQGNNSLVELDPSAKPAFSPLATIPLSFTPGVVALSPNSAMAYVSPLVPEFAGGSNTLYEIDLATKTVVKTIVDESQPLGSIAIAPNGKTAYAWGDDVVPIDLSSGLIGAPIAHSSGSYTDFEIAPNGRTAIATSDGPSPNYQEIDLTTGKVIRTVSTAHLHLHNTMGFWSPENIAFTPNGTTVLVTLEHETAHSTTVGLLRSSSRTGMLESSTNLESGLAGNVLITSDSQKAFVFVQTGAFTVVPIDLATGKTLPRITIGHNLGLGLLQLARSSTLFAVDTQWKVATIDERTDRILSSSVIPVPSLLAPTLQPLALGG